MYRNRSTYIYIYVLHVYIHIYYNELSTLPGEGQLKKGFSQHGSSPQVDEGLWGDAHYYHDYNPWKT